MATETAADLGTCTRCKLEAVASVKGSNEPLCWDHILKAREDGELSAVTMSAPRKPRYSVPKLKEAIQACDHNIKEAREWIETEEARKVEYWGYIEEIEQDQE